MLNVVLISINMVLQRCEGGVRCFGVVNPTRSIIKASPILPGGTSWYKTSSNRMLIVVFICVYTALAGTPFGHGQNPSKTLAVGCCLQENSYWLWDVNPRRYSHAMLLIHPQNWKMFHC